MLTRLHSGNAATSHGHPKVAHGIPCHPINVPQGSHKCPPGTGSWDACWDASYQVPTPSHEWSRHMSQYLIWRPEASRSPMAVPSQSPGGTSVPPASHTPAKSPGTSVRMRGSERRRIAYTSRHTGTLRTEDKAHSCLLFAVICQHLLV